MHRCPHKVFSGKQEPSRKQPLSPRATELPAKKGGRSEGNSTPRTGLKRFLGAVRQSGPDRTKLMKAMDGSTFYKCRGLFLQHSQGDMSAVDNRTLQTLKKNKNGQPLQAYSNRMCMQTWSESGNPFSGKNPTYFAK